MIVVVRLEGGLGNQLFQLSHGLALQKKHGGTLMFDRRHIRNIPERSAVLYHVTDLKYDGFVKRLISVFLGFYSTMCIRVVHRVYGRCDAASKVLSAIGVYHSDTTRYRKLHKPSMLPFVYLHGNWMSERYFDFAVDRVRSTILTQGLIGNKFLGLAKEISVTNSVAVHIRRGDYLSDEWREKLDVCDGSYYSRAVDSIIDKLESPVFYIFTNTNEDSIWIRDNYKFFPNNTVFVEPADSDLEHFALMVACDHFILANSTFSWWASYLSLNNEKVVVAPSRWNREVWDMQDIFLSEWTIVNINPS